MKAILAKVADGAPLSEAESSQAFEIIMSGQATPSQIGAFLMALRIRGETVEEITGAVKVMRAMAIPVKAPPDAIDIAGTGGDASGTFNVSTGAALAVAGCGVVVAKHGNKAQSSKSGSADVLAALGVNINAPIALVEQSMREANIGFMMAPRHHAAMRHVGPARSEMGIRTIFNLLGPLSNPAQVKRQFTGVFARRWAEPMARALGALGCEHAWVAHGQDGLDELTTTGPSFVAEINHGRIRCFEVTPELAGLDRADPASLKGGPPKDNALAMLAMLDGKKSPFRDIVIYNAAAALIVAGKARDLESGAGLAAKSIDSGMARTALDKLVKITNQ